MESVGNYCIICRELFSCEKDLLDHKEKEHASKMASKFHCISCNKDFRDSFNLKRHLAFVHSPKSESIFQNKTRCLLCSKCFTRKEIYEHFLLSHEIKIEEENLEFNSWELFESWKIEMENETRSKYVKVRNVYKRKDGTTLNTFYCHRDGYVKISKGRNLRRMKVFGSNKINGHCPSKLVVRCDVVGSVSVKFVKTHVGHSTDLNRISLNRREKEALAMKLSMNIPFDQILDEIRDSLRDSDLQRVHLLSKQDLRNIARDFKVRKNDISSDHEHVDSCLEKISTFEPSFVRLYKRKGITSNDFPQLKTKDFLLVTMNEIQKEMLDKFGNNYLCIDITRGIHLQDFDMFTLYVLDDVQRVFPCVFAFSNRSDIVVMELIFLCVQDAMKRIINPELLLTSDTLHDAWCAIMAAPSSHLYCPWHLDLDWRSNLKKIKDKEKQTIVYKELRKLLEEKDVANFNRDLRNLCFELQNDKDTKDFLLYFEKYKNSCEKWADCYRTNLVGFVELERFHKSLKYIYLKRNDVLNLVTIICSIMSFLRRKYLDLPLSQFFDRLMEVKNSHKIAINMTQANLRKVNSSSWDVSDSNNEEVYRVEENKSCYDDCPLKCKPCDVCIHHYTCTCYESTLKWTMCQHIHIACIVAKHENSVMLEPNLEKPIELSDETSECDASSLMFSANDSDSESLAIISHISDPVNSNLQIELKKKEFLEKFSYLLNSATNSEQLDLISKRLSSLEQALSQTNKGQYGYGTREAL